jgi:hypothetical protein
MPSAAAPWFRRLGDIPDFVYRPQVAVDCDRLRGRKFQPTPDSGPWNRDGLSWPSLDDPNTPGSRAPAEQHLGEVHDTRIPVETVIRRLSEALELPGTARDYHEILARVAGSFWHKRRRPQSGALLALERFALLDVQLFRLLPEVLQEDLARTPPLPPSSLLSLNELYRSEGFLQEALAAGREAERYTEGRGHAAHIETLLEAWRVEDGTG